MRHLFRLTVSFLFIFLIAMPTQSGEAKAKLKDIPSSYEREITYLMDKGIISGYPDGTFRPNNNVTRADAAIMVVNALGLSTKTKSSFKDVPANHYATQHIEAARKAGIIGGYPDKTYRPNQGITRGEMAIVLSNAFEMKEKKDIYYTDIMYVDPKYAPIQLITTAGISTGYPDGTYRPNNKINRAEFATMVVRTIDTAFKAEYKGKPDKQFVTASSLNVRKGPGTSHAVVGKFPLGEVVEVLHKHDKTWALVKSGNVKGYVHQSYLSKTEASNPKPATKNRVIAIDAGHGGSDPGASGNGLVEKEINLNVAKRVETKLKNAGISVVMTRKNDTYISLANRVKIATDAKADTFVSIHTNSFSSGSANGTETFYSAASRSTTAQESKKLAEFIQKRLVKAMGTSDRGVKTAGFHVIKQNPLPSALVELAFITNKSDANKLASDKYRDAAAGAIAQGIVDYYNWKEK